MNKFIKIAAFSVATVFALPASGALAVDEQYAHPEDLPTVTNPLLGDPDDPEAAPRKGLDVAWAGVGLTCGGVEVLRGARGRACGRSNSVASVPLRA